jgi:hypothetical protein
VPIQAFESEEFMISESIGLLLHGFDFYIAPLGDEAGGTSRVEMGTDQERFYLPHGNQKRSGPANPYK